MRSGTLQLRVARGDLLFTHCCVFWYCSGTITVEEMREGLRRKGGRIPETELQRIMDMADVNGDGRVDYGEFLAATLNLNKLEREDVMYRAFQVCGGRGRRGLEAAYGGWTT